jgi:hypothetical protein
MKKAVYLSLLIVVLAGTSSFANKLSDDRETRDLSGFTNISFGTSGYLYITFGSEYKVILEGDRSYLDEIVTEIRGDRLIIRNRRNNWHFRMNQKVTIYITLPELNGLGVSGSGKAEIKDALKSTDLKLNVSGSGRILTGDINVSRLDCGISGSGNINLEGGGNVSRADISISGSGGYSGESAKIDMADISISGSGNCSCNVTGSLKAGVSGSGNVTYIGNPKIDARVSGSGRVRSR